MPLSNDPYEDPTQAASIGERPNEDPTAGREVGETPFADPTQGRKSASGRVKTQGGAG
jgi:hypothetical protein